METRVAMTNEISTRFWRMMGFGSYLETVVREVAE
jgi:hypothetical protein